MAPLRSIAAATLLLLSSAQAHFYIVTPPSLEGNSIDEKKEGTSPCGALVPDLANDKATDFHVEGDVVSWYNGHPQGDFLIRATLDKATDGNWTELYPVLRQSGQGNFCAPAVTAPKEWVGKTGVIGIACDAPDGLLYQCAVVKFVEGSGKPAASTCTNQTGVTASFENNPTLASLVGVDVGGGSSTPTPSGSAAPGQVQGQFPFGSILAASAMVLLGTALL